ncbi:MAG: ATP-dependent zinc metalloprotease FtsH [Lachnospiraceae bacterium]|nr:ATP-dependent zinc metalloprotease FtsH [Lachnospiraceae bacterium]
MEQNQNNRNGNNGGKSPQRRTTWIAFAVFAILTCIGISFFSSFFENATTKEITFDEFLEMVEEDEVKSVTFETSGRIVIIPKDSRSSMNALTQIKYYTGYLNDEELLPLLKEKNVKIKADIQNTNNTVLDLLLMYALPVAIVWIGLGFLMRKMSKGGGMMGVGKSNAKVYVEKSTGVTFRDVAGQEEAKESLQEVVDFLHFPGKYAQIGAKLPKGALLIGPPGTGKTLLAKAVAGEAKVPFFSLTGSDFVEMFVGVGASRVRDLFKQAQESAPCIVFIDEIDAIGKSRDSRYGGNDEREQTLNQLLSEMDGFDTSKGLLILAATNRPDVLDKALLRPGRFDRRVIVDKPDLKGRLDTLRVHSQNVPLDETVDLNEIALATAGTVGSDLANIINEAAINAVKHGRRLVSQADLFESVEVVIAGKEKKDRLMNDREKRTVAYHEVGHALVTALTKDSEPVQKITIVPRTMGTLGYVMQVPEEEKYMKTRDELEAELLTLLAGRAAEEIVFDTVTTGAANDIERATAIARAMITQYGMSEKFGLVALETIQDQYLERRRVANCGEETESEVDREVMQMIKVRYEEAKGLLLENRECLDAIADFLFQKETITGKEFMEIFHRIRGGEAAESKDERPAEPKEIETVEMHEEPESSVSQNQPGDIYQGGTVYGDTNVPV